MNFWQNFSKPIMAVAPMADVTDAAFRRLIAKYSSIDVQSKNAAEREVSGALRAARPSLTPPTRRSAAAGGNHFVTWTEFVAADGLVRATPEGKEKLMTDLIYSEAERPIVAQLFSSTEEHMEYAANLCRELGFDGVDINMGCPDRSIEKQGCGSAMIKTPEVAKRIIAAAKRGARHGAVDGIPVSVKTRLGYNQDEVENWIPALLAEAPAALTVHCRTRKEMSKVPARWERLARVVELRNELAPETVILGNGDVLSLKDATEKVEASGADGAMIGRALFGNPWFFHPNKRLPVHLTALPTKGVNRDTLYADAAPEEGVEFISLPERLQVMVEHAHLFAELLPHKNFNIMKKHFKAYVNSFPGAAELRAQLMEGTNSPTEVERVVHDFLEQRTGGV